MSGTETEVVKTVASAEKKAPAKKAPKAKAKKTTKAKKASSAKRGGPRLATKFAGKRIKLLVKENPKREGTRSYKAFNAYKNGMPIEKALEELKKVGFGANALRWDIAHKFVALH